MSKKREADQTQGEIAPADQPLLAAESRSAKRFVAGLAEGSARRKRKISVTVDADLWDEAMRLVHADAADSASSAVENALALWAANQRLRQLLDELYEEMPEARPAEDMVEAAAHKLGRG